MSVGAEETPTAAVPGTGQPTDPTPPAEASNTEGVPPETIPYSRFKEVNDAYRPYRDLADQGYDADSLRRLAEWEQAFSSDPAGSWLSLAGSIEGLPEPVLEAIRQANGTAEETPPETPGSGTPPPEDDFQKPPEWAQPLIEDYHHRIQAGEQQARDQVLNDILTKWDELDKAEGLVNEETGQSIVPANIRLSFIAGAAGSATSQEQILEIARKEAIEMLEVGRRSVHVPSGGETPRPVPGSAAVTPAPPIKPKTLAEATAMAKADIEAGRLQI